MVLKSQGPKLERILRFLLLRLHCHMIWQLYSQIASPRQTMIPGMKEWRQLWSQYHGGLFIFDLISHIHRSRTTLIRGSDRRTGPVGKVVNPLSTWARRNKRPFSV